MRTTKNGALFPINSLEKVAVFDAVEFYLHEQQDNPYDKGESWLGDELSLLRIRERLRPHVDRFYSGMYSNLDVTIDDRLLFNPEDTRLLGNVMLHTAYFNSNQVLGNYCLTLLDEVRKDSSDRINIS